MAATIAIARGWDSSRVKETHRLGSRMASADANTWRTFVHAEVEANGAGIVRVKRDGVIIHSFVFGPEDQEGTDAS